MVAIVGSAPHATSAIDAKAPTKAYWQLLQSLLPDYAVRSQLSFFGAKTNIMSLAEIV